MYSNSSLLKLNLQLFAESGAGGDTGTGGTTGVPAADAAQQSKGVKNPLAAVQYGKQPTEAPVAGDAAPQVAPEERQARFEALIKGEFKDLYDARMQDTIQKRLKSTKEVADKYTALTPTLEMLAGKYGVKADDIEALSEAIQEDDSYYEDEAFERGITVEQLKSIRKMERENAELKRQIAERQTRENADKLYNSWMQQAEETKRVFPQFDLNTEMQSPRFLDLLKSNVDVRTAFQVLHQDEIMPAAMQYTAQNVASKLSASVAANGARPVENGLMSQSAATIKSDVSQLSKADRQELIRRVQRGERVIL